MNDFDTVKDLAAWMVVTLSKHPDWRNPNIGVNWDALAAEVWRAYTGIFNEFIINDAIDMLIEVSLSEQD